jgi:short-subunit dehydrogenase
MADRRTAVITGASSGIGEACARAFAREGLHVVLAARREAELARVAADIAAAGGAATAVPCDVTDAAQVEALVARAVAVTGRLDVVVANAGLGYNGRLDETDLDTMRHLMEVNYFGTFHAASIVGRKGVPRMGAYAATKFAQVGLGESVRAELAGTGVHVTLVYPISTETGFRSAMAREWGQDVAGAGPRQSPDHVAATMVRALRRPRADIYPMRASRLVAAASALVPGLADWVSAKFTRTPKK